MAHTCHAQDEFAELLNDKRLQLEFSKHSIAQCFLIGWMVHPRVNKIFAGVNQPKGVNKGEPSGDQTEVMQ